MKSLTHVSLLSAALFWAVTCAAYGQPAAGQTAPAAAMATSQQTSTPAVNATAAASSAVVPPANAAPANSTPAAAPLTEDMLRHRYEGKLVFLRGLYVGDNLNFDMDGKVDGAPGTASFTLSALQVRKVSLTKKKVEFEAYRYALHFDGALPYESDAQSFDKVRISKKPIRITIERELVVTPKKKKEKAKDKAKDKQDKKDATLAKGVTPAPAPTTIEKPAPLPPGTTTSPAHSAMLLKAALNKVFAFDIDDEMVAHLPPYWQRYFESKRNHHEFEPSNPSILEVGNGVTPPRVLNSIDPSSNQYAQKYGIAGLTLFRTVVDASGKPEEVAITRPIGFGLDEGAVKAIKASHFTPAMKDGKPVPAVVDVVVTFRIYSNRTKPGSVAKGEKLTQVVASAWDSAATDTSSKKSKPIQ